MGEPNLYQKIHQRNLQGWLRADLCRHLPKGFFADPESYVRAENGQTLKETRDRWAAIFYLPDGKGVFIKKDRTKNGWEKFKYLFLPSKARKEWFLAHQLQRRKVQIPIPYGWLEKVHRGSSLESYYLSEAILGGKLLIENAMILKEEIHMKQLAQTVLQIHFAQLFHGDLHAGNFLWDGDIFYLTDLHRGKIMSSLSMDQRLWDLAHLFHSLRQVWEARDHERFLETYFEGEPLPPRRRENLLRILHHRMDRLQKRQWRSRTKRCLKESTEFSVHKKAGTTIYRLREFPLERLEQVILDHQTCKRDHPSCLVKRSHTVWVSVLGEGPERICVKEFGGVRFWDHLKDYFRTAKGIRAWVSGNGLRVRGIPSLKMLALVEKKRGGMQRQRYVVMEVPKGGREMDRYLHERRLDFKRRRAFLRAFAQWLSHLHQKGLYHQDMKTCNLWVMEEGEGWKFFLLDLEDLWLDTKVDERRLFRNLLQINTSIPKAISRTDRLRFYLEYQRHFPIVRGDRAFLTRLLKKTRERGILYVSPEGIIEEAS